MFIPFAGHWINPAHITRMVYLPGKRLTICLADGHPALTETAPTATTAGVDIDKTFRGLMTHCLTFKAVDAPLPPAVGERVEIDTLQTAPPPLSQVTVTAPKGRKKR